MSKCDILFFISKSNTADHEIYFRRILFSNGNWRSEKGEYEDHDGTTVFVIRGVFSYYTKEVSVTKSVYQFTTFREK